MRETKRLDDFYNTLKNIHKRLFLDYRFGQFMSNFFNWVNNIYHKDIFFIEEDEMLNLIKEYANTYSCWYRDN